MRDWLNAIFGTEGGRAAQMVLALVVVLLFILLLAWLFRRFTGSDASKLKSNSKLRGRLAITDAKDIDSRRRLVLLRRDDVEHLILIGGPNDLLIESRILRAGGQQRQNVQPMPRPSDVAPYAGTTGPAGPAAADQLPYGQTGRLTAGTGTPLRPELPVMEPVLAPNPLTSEHVAFDAPPPSRPAREPMAAPRAASGGQPSAPTGNLPRRPTLGDVLSAATATAEARVDAPDRGDGRDEPTLIMSAPPSAGSDADTAGDRESQVRGEIERALADLGTDVPATPAAVPLAASAAPVTPPPAAAIPAAAAPAAAEPTSVTVPQPAAALSALRSSAPPVASPRPIHQPRAPEPTGPTRPAAAPASASEAPTQQRTAPTSPAPARTLTQNPLRPATPAQSAPASAPERSSPTAMPARAPASEMKPFTATQNTPIPRPKIPAGPSFRTTVPTTPPPAEPAPASDELEEEMARLLSELGGQPNR